jgi:hypothetical protein
MELDMGVRDLVQPDQYRTVQNKWKNVPPEESVASSYATKLAHH